LQLQMEEEERDLRSIGQARCLRKSADDIGGWDWVDCAILVGMWLLALPLSIGSIFTLLRYIDYSLDRYAIALAQSVVAHVLLNGAMAVWSKASIAWLAASLSAQRRKLYFPQLLGALVVLCWYSWCCVMEYSRVDSYFPTFSCTVCGF
jgi:hypothetical protein